MPPADPLLACDRRWSADWRRRLAGVDEAGRGCLAGPVVAAAVVLPPRWRPAGLDDSKRLTVARRERLYTTLVRDALAWGVAAVSPRDIERTDILRATLRAMAAAVRLLQPSPAVVLVDGNRLPPLPVPAHALVGGDHRSAAVAAASVLAKVVRDRLLVELDRRHPGYGLARHKGYGTAGHLAVLRERGPSPVHRRTFAPVAGTAQGRLW